MGINPTNVFKKNATWLNHVMRNLVSDVLAKGRVLTTEARAKLLKQKVDKIITKAKKQTLAARRDVEAFLRPITVNGVKIGRYLFETIALKYKDRNGGYTRIIKAPNRRGDNTKMAYIELV
ncbi:MAG: 50S ribosomal protein L17 [Mycoplasma sp.]|nr:50S ribosomal protein L17 [Mycoplasma sp.]